MWTRFGPGAPSDQNFDLTNHQSDSGSGKTLSLHRFKKSVCFRMFSDQFTHPAGVKWEGGVNASLCIVL